MDPMPLEDLALLEVLQHVDQAIEIDSGDTEIRQRMVESGLASAETGTLRLTAAGIELCKSLQHRVAADAQAAKILEGRKADGDVVHAGNGATKLDRPTPTST